MAAGEPLDEGEIRVISAWFARHGAQRRSAKRIWGDEENPSAAWIAWLLWGGDDAREWSDRVSGRATLRDSHRLEADLRRLGLL